MTDKIPQSVSIGGKTIGIVVEEMESWGEYRSDDRQIALSHKATVSESDLIETLRHEMVHAALDIGGISHLKNYEEESIVRCLDTIFHPAWETVRQSLNQ
jgi:hypothetical protein